MGLEILSILKSRKNLLENQLMSTTAQSIQIIITAKIQEVENMISIVSDLMQGNESDGN